jgi:proteic killer suppression protein
MLCAVIRSYGDADTRDLFEKGASRRFRAIERVALRKLQQLNAAVRLEEMAAPPANRLEALKGDRKGQYSIRINDQWRICFRWHEGDAFEAEIVDYH